MGLRIPLLNLAGLPLLNAFAINLFVIPFSSAVGAFTHRAKINRSIALLMILGGIFGSLLGAFLAGLIPSLDLAIIFVIVSILTVAGVYLDRIAPRLADKIQPTPLTIAGGVFGLNVITGMRGGSGGSLFPPFLKALHLDIHEAIGTSLAVTIFTALAAIAVYWGRGDIPFIPALVVLIGSTTGARIGSKLSLRAKPLWLEISLSALVLILALLTVLKAI